MLLQYVWAGDEPLPILGQSHTLSAVARKQIYAGLATACSSSCATFVSAKSRPTLRRPRCTVSKVTIPIRSRLSFRYRNDWSGENRGRGRPRWGGRRQNSNLALGMPKADSTCYRRLSPMIMLERLSSVEAYKVVAMIDWLYALWCTRLMYRSSRGSRCETWAARMGHAALRAIEATVYTSLLKLIYKVDWVELKLRDLETSSCQLLTSKAVNDLLVPRNLNLSHVNTF